MFSGGIASWGAAKRLQEQGIGPLTLLFTDTMMEDEDLYRFLLEAAANVDGELVRLADGRNPWQVFADVKYLGNSRIDPCSRILKRELSERWLEKNCDPSNTIRYYGYDWTEIHRLERTRSRLYGWQVEGPLCEPPWLTRPDLFAWLKEEGLEPPRLYEWASHNNCGGFCVKAGQGHFAKLLENMPERYAEHEAAEQRLRDQLGDVSIMRDRTGGVVTPLTLRVLRRRIQHKQQVDMLDIGGCGCFDEPDEIN